MKKHFLFALFITTTVILYAQHNNFKTFGIEEGLPQSEIFSLIQDSKGFLWIGTNGGGLCRFDGKNIDVFNKKSGLLNNTIRAILEDSKGNIWVGTYEGVTILNGYKDKVISITHEDGLTGNQTMKIFEDSRKNIWVATFDGGLNKIRIDKNDSVHIDILNTDNGLSSIRIFDIIEDHLNRIWVGTYGGGIDILTYQDDSLIIDNLSHGFDIPSNGITCLAIDHENNIWAGTYNSGVFKIFNQEEFTGFPKVKYEMISGLNDNRIWDIKICSNNKVWIGTASGGINRIENNTVKYITKDNGLPNNQVFTIFEDVDKNIWFGTFGNGFCQFRGDHFSHYSADDGLPDEQINCIAQNVPGKYWLATYGDGLYNLSKNDQELKFQNIKKADLNDDFLNAITFDDNGDMWIASANKGIYYYKNSKFFNYTSLDGLVYDVVNCLHIDSKNRLWIGTEGGISIYNNKGFFNITKSSDYQLINNSVQTIIEDKANNIWAGTLGGLARFQLGKNMAVYYDEKDGLDEMKIYSLAEDKNGDIWIGTFGGGVYKFNMKKENNHPIEYMFGDEVISSNNIYSLLFYNTNTLIIATNKGLSRVNLNDSMQIESVRIYDKSNGFIGVETYVNSIYKDYNDKVWIGTVKGLTSYNPKVEKEIHTAPQINITGLHLFHEEVDWINKTDSVLPWFNVPYKPILKYSENQLTFMFSGISLSNPDRIRYKYKLEGWENTWSPPRQITEVVYSGLKPGEYVFKVLTENENGIWNDTPLSYEFTIESPYWQRWWFYVLVSIATILLIILFVYLREKQLIHEKKILEQKVKERTYEIQQQNIEISKQKKEIEEKNNDIMDSIRYANRIQEAMLPSDTIVEEFSDNVFVLFKPRDIVSGDFYWLEKRNGKLLFSAVDCTGHGVPGAFMSIIGYNGLNRCVREYNLIHPADILEKLNSIVAETLRKTEKSDVKDGMDMALCMYDDKNMNLEYSGAYNSLYLIREKGKNLIVNGEEINAIIENENYNLFEIKADKQPIGDFSTKDPFKNYSVKIKKNDTIYTFTDGFADQFGGPHIRKFMYKPFKRLLLSCQEKSMKEQHDLLEVTFTTWKGDYNQIDDVCILGLKI
ncbi:two-component regulator propeller domain-containing protein [Bacteroidota bacterium]